MSRHLPVNIVQIITLLKQLGKHLKRTIPLELVLFIWEVFAFEALLFVCCVNLLLIQYLLLAVHPSSFSIFNLAGSFDFGFS